MIEHRDIRDYGARPGDPVDVSGALAAALEGDEPIDLYIPPGAYVGTMRLRSHVAVSAAGATLRLPVARAVDPFASVVTIGESWPSAGPLVEDVQLYGLAVDGLRSVGGPYDPYPDGYRMGISLGHCRAVLLCCVAVRDCYTDGLLFGPDLSPRDVTMLRVTASGNGRHGCSISGGRGLRFAACQFRDNGGVHPYGDGVDIEDESATVAAAREITFDAACVFASNVGRGVSVQSHHGMEYSDIAICGTCVGNAGGDDVAIYPDGACYEDITVGITGRGVSVGASGPATFRGLRATGCKLTGGIALSGALATYLDAEITGNAAAQISVTETKANGLRIAGNDVRAAPVPDSFGDVGICVVGVAGPGVEVAGNDVRGGCFGIQSSGNAGLLVDGNRVSGQRAVAGGGGYGIYLAGERHVVTRNRIADADGRGLSCSASDSTVIRNEITRCAGGDVRAEDTAGLYFYGNDSEIAHNVVQYNGGGPRAHGDIYEEPGASGNNLHDNTETP